MLGFELDTHRGEQPPDQRLGQRGELFARLPRSHGSRQQPGRNQELLLLRNDAGAFDHFLIVARLGKKRVDLSDQHRRPPHLVVEGRVDQRVHHMGAVDDRFGHARCRGEQLHQQVAQLPMGAQQREQLHARWQPPEEIVEPLEGEVGIAGARDGGQQRRQQFGQVGAGRRCTRGAIAAIVPLADRCRHCRGLVESHFGQRLERCRVVVATGENEIAAVGAQRFAFGEQFAVVVLHAIEGRPVCGFKGLPVGKTHQLGDDPDPLFALGHHMGLLVAQHLQPVLDGAQEPVGFGQLARCRFGNPAGPRQRRQRLGRRPDAQRLVAATGDQLLGLREELDLANTTAPELDVVAGDPRRADILGDVDLALHGLDVGDGREVQMLSPDVGGEFGDKGFADSLVTGAGPRLDPGGAFPVLSPALIIGERGLDRDRHRGRTGVGPQPQIGAEHVVVASLVLHHRRQLLDDARIDLGRLVRVLQQPRLAFEESDDVDIG